VAMLQFVDNELFNHLLNKGRKSKIAKTRQLASWAIKEIKKMKTSIASGNNMPNAGLVAAASES